MAAELVYACNLVDGLALLPTNLNLISGNGIPVLDMVLRFCRLNSGVAEGRPPLPMTIVRQETPEAFVVRAGCPGLEGLVPAECFCDRRCWRCVRTVEAPRIDPGRGSKRLTEVMDTVSVV